MHYSTTHTHTESNEGKRLFQCLGKLSGTGSDKVSKWGFLGMSSILSHARWTVSLFQALVKRTPVAESWNYLGNVARMIVDERSAQNINRADLLQGMVKLMSNETHGDNVDLLAFSKAEAVLNSRIFILAGFETTRNAISMTCYHLAADHKIQGKAFDEIDKYFAKNPNTSLHEVVESISYIEMVVLEALRHHPVTKDVGRHCVKTCAIGDTLIIPEGTNVYIPTKTVNFNSDYWTHPDVFDPERFDPSVYVNSAEGFLSFGAGPRLCIGKRLGLLDAEMALVSILKMYKLSLADNTNIEIDDDGLILYPKYGVQLKVTPR